MVKSNVPINKIAFHGQKTKRMSQKIGKVAVVYPFIPHYRMPVFRALLENDKFREYKFFAGNNKVATTIKSEVMNNDSSFIGLPTFTVLGVTFQFGLFWICLLPGYRHLIFMSDPYVITNWIYAALARIAGKKVWFWTHGWLRLDSGFKGWMRKLFYKLPHGLLLYGDRAKSIGIQSGFNPDRLHVIYNSLDYDQQRTVRERFHYGILSLPCTVKAPGWINTHSYFACVARLTELCRFDLAIESLALLRKSEGFDVGMVFIGDGPQRSYLQALALRKEVRCWFLGAVYDEEIIGALLYHARAVVSPGKVGLTAMHSLAYGTPVISHDDFGTQMPEFEAIVPGKTGDFFSAGNASALAKVMERWLNKVRDDEERKTCYSRVEECYTPQRQRDLIEAALSTQD